MEKEDRIEELLEALWLITVEAKKDTCDIELLKDDAAIKDLMKMGYVNVQRNQLSLTEEGKGEAMKCVRRHRLAERLLADVLDEKNQFIHETSCKFEHLLHKGLEKNICTLLGHPTTCPHGKPIPPGSCCLDASKEQIKKIIVPLTQLEMNKKGKVAYVHTGRRDILQKIIAMGVLPKTEVLVRQRFPAYVIQIGKSQFAVDEELASHVYVRQV
jgi:DtxR family transcriptional regulator, Mn-dependent transcriptional regulator